MTWSISQCLATGEWSMLPRWINGCCWRYEWRVSHNSSLVFYSAGLISFHENEARVTTKEGNEQSHDLIAVFHKSINVPQVSDMQRIIKHLRKLSFSFCVRELSTWSKLIGFLLSPNEAAQRKTTQLVLTVESHIRLRFLTYIQKFNLQIWFYSVHSKKNNR